MAHTHPVKDMDKHFIIDPITRAITNAESKKTLLMQNDHNSEQFSFEINRIVEGHDIMKCNRVEIHYSNIDSTKRNSSLGVYSVTDMQLNEDETKVIFTWLVSEHATIHPGSLSFLILFACIENEEVVYRWNTGINTSIAIAKGMYNGDFVVESYPDILAQWYNDLDEWRTAHDTELSQVKTECNEATVAANEATEAAKEATEAANTATKAAKEATNTVNESTVMQYASQAKTSAESASAASAAATEAADQVQQLVANLEGLVTEEEVDALKTELQGSIDEIAGYPKIKRTNLPTSAYVPEDGSEVSIPLKFGTTVTGIGADDLIEVRIDYDSPNMTDDKDVYREAMRNAMITTDSIVANDNGSYTIWLVCDGEFPAQITNMRFLIINHGPGVSW